MNPAAGIEIQIIDRELRKIAAKLDLPTAPDRLDRGQIAKVAGLGNARSLAASLERGVKERHPKWLAFSSTIRKGSHLVPAARVARWLAIDEGTLPMPMPPAAPAADPAAELDRAWRGAKRAVRCKG